MLENRMRRPSKIGNANNDESLKTIKSTDSKKAAPILHKLAEDAQEETPPQCSNIRLSEDELRRNKKITDYFPMRHHNETPMRQSLAAKEEQLGLNSIINSLTQSSRSPASPEDKSSKGSADEALREENRVLRERLKDKEEVLWRFKQEIVESTIKLHRVKRNEMRLRVSNNKIRLGESLSDKKGKEQWIDGTEYR